MRHYTLFFTSALLIISTFCTAQVAKDSELFVQLKKIDSIFFEEGFNACNFEVLETYIPKDFEFYHDQGGIQNRAQFLKAFKDNICTNTQKKPIRKVVQESLEVYPLYDNGKRYGAIQKGIHQFYIKEPGKELYLTNIAKFTSVWILVDGNWKLSRVLSYDHQEPNKDYGQKFDANWPVPLFDTDAKILKLLKQHKIPSISIGYINDGVLQQLRTFGVQKEGVPVASQSIYKVASLTKPIVALVVLKLIDAGQWSLDEPISKYFIDGSLKHSEYVDKVTTRHILSHQSGFPNWRYLTVDKKLSFQFEPGTRWHYSGEGFEYLRKAIEKKLKRPFENIARETLFEPLGMRNTYFNWNGTIDEQLYAVEHDEHGDPIPFKKYTNTNAAANLMTTVEDYATFMIHILNGAGISKKLYSEFLKPQSHQKKGIDWGLGMQLLSNLPDGDLAFMHTGGDYGTKTIAIGLKNSRRGLILFSNSENGIAVWQKIITEYFGAVGMEIVKRNVE
ncbi:serine hydrolase [Aquimarina sp. W85]|uniref:serine hydrolase n=1 Tax=Aquimarina rhodophyticola TaxID=3342246 RepID=UPI00366C73D1